MDDEVDDGDGDGVEFDDDGDENGKLGRPATQRRAPDGVPLFQRTRGRCRARVPYLRKKHMRAYSF